MVSNKCHKRELQGNQGHASGSENINGAQDEHVKKISCMVGPAQCAHHSHTQCLKLDKWFRVLIFLF